MYNNSFWDIIVDYFNLPNFKYTEKQKKKKKKKTFG